MEEERNPFFGPMFIWVWGTSSGEVNGDVVVEEGGRVVFCCFDSGGLIMSEEEVEAGDED